MTSQSFRTIDYHTAGEPFRIVLSGLEPPPGETVRARRANALPGTAADKARQVLCHEPRGHADMYGCFLTPPDDPGAHFGALFWHKDGFSTACGHGTIALGVWAVSSGLVPAAKTGTTDVVIDVPSGRVTARVHSADGRIVDVTFRNIPSYVLAQNVPLELNGAEVLVDISYGGAIYASIPAVALGLEVTPDHYSNLIAAGRLVKAALANSAVAEHPDDPLLSGIYGTILYDDLGGNVQGPHQRNVTIFADGEADRSPCGSGTSARAALLATDGQLRDDGVLVHDSIIGTRFTAKVIETIEEPHRTSYITEVRGMAYQTGEHHFVVNDEDPTRTGFVLR